MKRLRAKYCISNLRPFVSVWPYLCCLCGFMAVYMATFCISVVLLKLVNQSWGPSWLCAAMFLNQDIKSWKKLCVTKIMWRFWWNFSHPRSDLGLKTLWATFTFIQKKKSWKNIHLKNNLYPFQQWCLWVPLLIWVWLILKKKCLFPLLVRLKTLLVFFTGYGCISYCPSVAMKKSLRVFCKKSKVGRSSGLCLQHIIMIS